MIDSLIWDAGGTLFDTYPSAVQAALTVLSPYGHEIDPAQVAAYLRKSTAYAHRRLAELLTLDVFEFQTRYEKAYEAIDPACQAPFPYVVETCRWVAETGGRNFIVTHRESPSLERLMDAHKMRSYFADWITKSDPYPRKPDPASLLALVDRHRLDPARCLVVGDRDLDMLAGVRAGMKTCLFGGAAHATPVDLEVTGFDQLLDWLNLQRRQGAVAS